MANKNLKKEFNKLLSTLENLVLTGVLKPRERLIETDLAQNLNISRYWIRDALKNLENKGLVKIIPYKGAVVADLSEKEIKDIYSIRIALEKLAIQLALDNIKPSDIKTLKKLATQFEDYYKNNKIPEMININDKFHDYIFELSHNQILIQMIIDMRTRAFIVRYAAWSTSEILLRIIEEHQSYIRALKEKDLKTLDLLSERHISYSKDFYLAQLSTIKELVKRT